MKIIQSGLITLALLLNAKAEEEQKREELTEE